jgi:hypothetical protein
MRAVKHYPIWKEALSHLEGSTIPSEMKHYPI